ncbi:MAG: O-antigen ligase family protein [Synechococcales cyanobacterium]
MTQPLPQRGAQLAGLVSLIVLSAFSFVPDSFREMVRWPGVVVWQIGLGSAALALALWMRQGQLKRLGSGLDLLIGYVACLGILSLIISPVPGVTLWYILMAAGYVCLLYGLYVSDVTAKALAHALASLGLASSVLSLVVWFPLRETTDFGQGFQNKWLLGHHNFVGGYLALVLPFTAALALATSGWKRILYLCGSLVLLVNLYTTSSRGAILGLGIAVVVGWLGYFLLSQAKNKRLILTLGLACILILGTIVLSHPRVQGLIQIRWDSAQTIELDANAQYRMTLWKTSWQIGQERPLTGVGLGTLSRVYNFYAANTGWGNPIPNIHQAHSTFFQILAELGWPGVTAYLAFFAVMTRLWYTNRFHLRTWPEHCLNHGVGLALVSYGVSSLTDYQLENSPIALSLVLLIVIQLKLRGASETSTEPPELLSVRSLSLSRVLAFIPTGYILLALFTQAPIDYALYLGHSITTDSSPTSGNQSYLKLIRASHFAPNDPIYPLMAANQLRETLTNPQLDAATRDDLETRMIKHYEAAVNVAPAVDIINIYLGRALLDRDPQSAQVYLKRAVDISTSSQFNYYSYYLLGLAYLNQGNQALAIQAFVRQSLTDPAFLTYPLWQNPKLYAIHPEVLQATLDFVSQVPESIFHPENSVLLQWWFHRPYDSQNIQHYRPITQILLLSQSDPDQARQIATTLQDSEQRFWLALALGQTSNLRPEQLQSSIEQHQWQINSQLLSQLLQTPKSPSESMRAWLTEPVFTIPWSGSTIGSGLYAFRNTSLSNAFFVEHILDQLGIPKSIGLWIQPSSMNAPLHQFLHQHRL